MELPIILSDEDIVESHMEIIFLQFKCVESLSTLQYSKIRSLLM